MEVKDQKSEITGFRSGNRRSALRRLPSTLHLPPSDFLVIGIGNEFRGDDGLGLCVARELRKSRNPGMQVVESSGDAASLMEAWRGQDRVAVVDAVNSGGVPGSVYRVDVSTRSLLTHFCRSSSHAFGLAEAIEMARELRQLPRSLILFGIEGEAFGYGFDLSESVGKSIPELIRKIEKELEGGSRIAAVRA
jgi:hydrogenase maturation protease